MNYSKISKQILKKWYIVVIAVLAALIIAVAARGIFVKAEYTSTANCYVSFVYDSENGNDLTDGLLNNFMNLSKTASILTAVAEDASIKMLGYTVEELTHALDIFRQNNLIVINCKMRDPIDSQLVAQAYLNAGLPKVKSFLTNNFQNFQYTIVSMPEEGKRVDSKSLPIYLLSVLVGGLVGVGIALIPLFRGRVAYDCTEIQPMFNTQLLAVLPDKNMRQTGKKPIDTATLMTEYDAAIGAMVSAIAEGKCSSVAIIPCTDKVKIGELMRQFGSVSAKKQATVIVDVDFREQALSKQCGIEQVGLSDYILGKIPREKLDVQIDNFVAIPSGKSLANAVPLLLAGQANELFETLRAEYKSLVLVVPAIDKYRDCLSLGKFVDGAVLVIDAATKSTWVRNAIDKLDQSAIKVLGIVMVNYPKYK